ncbi:DUF424 family protein [Candidatus Woesearchaeota archaeon]|jgi:hypothetical protein|nr:DUF424 family protein [Candidatus Woesearchaeota archaeon]MBT4835173.1 DUF424 family protein [Candidatus Woesearchaeota archaeon]MBT6735430.1 DUF424 family protein [Candidatus Woesearchaeota archaeon]MBT7169449.1 DUF424 family protein [Candidatus Woesearchaeota archaeon]MBT7474762.1 DUF424 family protein [Candidatus Woesearchaeota archaeon]
MYVKFHKSNDRYIVAISDDDLIGKEISEGDLNLNITERFYKGDIKSNEEIIKIMKDSLNLNIVGKNSIKLAITAGILEEDSIIKIDGVPHAQVFKLG